VQASFASVSQAAERMPYFVIPYEERGPRLL
jgi:hypothetical protein